MIPRWVVTCNFEEFMAYDLDIRKRYPKKPGKTPNGMSGNKVV